MSYQNLETLVEMMLFSLTSLFMEDKISLETYIKHTERKVDFIQNTMKQ